VRHLKLAAAALVVAAITGGCVTPAGEYVAADAATYDAVAPEYLEYVDADPKLGPEQKASRRRTVETWRIRNQSAGGTPSAR